MPVKQENKKAIYVYGFIPSEEAVNKSFDRVGIDGNDLLLISLGKISALASYVERDSFSEEQLEYLLQDPHWLQEKANHHHEILMDFFKDFAVLPLKFCTIYHDIQGIKQEVSLKEEQLQYLINLLKNKQEWSVKVYFQKDLLRNYVTAENERILSIRGEMDKASPGRKFFLKKRIEQEIEKELLNETHIIMKGLHRNLTIHSVQDRKKNIWSRQVTGRKDEMAFNYSFLIEKEKANEFKEEVIKFQKEYEKIGLVAELTGPWPPYDFLSE